MGNVSEFSVSAFIAFVIIFFPLLNLLNLVSGAAVAYFITRQCVSVASTQRSFDAALDGVRSTSSDLLSKGLAKFMHIRPVGGYEDCGVDLYTVAVSFLQQNNVTEYGPNLTITTPLDSQQFVYESSARSTFDVGPFVSMSGIPFVNQIPGLGKPARLSFRVERAIEHPIDYVKLGSSGGSLANNSPATINMTPSVVSAPGVDGSDWNYPNIYQMIQNAGQIVVSEDVMIVDAKNPNWTVSSAVCSSGQQVWIDTHADGQWSYYGATGQISDAEGDPSVGYDTGINVGALLSQVGNNGPEFKAGKSLLNYQAPSAGAVEFKIADGPDPGMFNDNSGTMTVRVIVTQ